jgi:hypothetical protein
MARANALQPNLRTGESRQKSIGGCQFITVHFVSPGFDINGNKFSFIAWFDNASDIALVNRVPAPSKFLLAKVGL